MWIGSGYTRLSCGGTIPRFAAFCYFVFESTRTTWASQLQETWASVAAVAAFTVVVVVMFLMLFDPHLTYRGFADCLFSLGAPALVGRLDDGSGESPPTRAYTAHDERVGTSGAGR